MVKQNLLVLLVCIISAGGAFAETNADVSGSWIFCLKGAGEEHAVRATLEVDGTAVTGRIYGTTLKGTFEDGNLDIVMSGKDGAEEGRFKGVLRDGRLSGSGNRSGFAFEWVGTRAVPPPPSPRTLTFEPKAYHRYMSAALEPALRVFPGDTIKTKLVDEDGRDESGNSRTTGGFPVLGPIYVEDALPGDVIAIRFNKIALNRDSGESGHDLIGGVAETEYVQHATRERGFNSAWKLDSRTETASLAKPSAKLSSLVLPMKPMIGIVGVAPPGQRVFMSQFASDAHGGQIDYNEIREGVTVYLPIYHMGGGLFLGNGQALQGDGELSGEGIETSLDVDFTVTVLPQRTFHMPYAENSTELMFVGVGGSLEQALKRATTGLAMFLEQEFSLKSTEAATVMGVAAQYRIAKLGGEQSTVVAKISKAVLQQLGQPVQSGANKPAGTPTTTISNGRTTADRKARKP
jgi:amidase